MFLKNFGTSLLHFPVLLCFTPTSGVWRDYIGAAWAWLIYWSVPKNWNVKLITLTVFKGLQQHFVYMISFNCRCTKPAVRNVYMDQFTVCMPLDVCVGCRGIWSLAVAAQVLQFHIILPSIIYKMTCVSCVYLVWMTV